MEKRWEETHRVLLHATADERVAGVSARARPTSARRRVASRRLPPFPPSNVYSDPAVEGPCSPVSALQRGELGAAAGGMSRRAQVIGDGRLWMEVVVATRPVGQRWMRPGVGLWPIWPSSIARSGGHSVASGVLAFVRRHGMLMWLGGAVASGGIRSAGSVQWCGEAWAWLVCVRGMPVARRSFLVAEVVGP
jgi:hypothetical protein